MKTLSKVNYGRPTNPAIEINPKEWWGNNPQACEHEGNWFYNYQGFIDEAKFIGHKFPTEKEMLEYIKENRDSITEYPGYRYAGNGKVWFRGNFAYWWVFSPDCSARCVYLNRCDQDAGSSSGNPRDGFLVPVLSESDSSSIWLFCETITKLEQLATQKESEAGKIREAIEYISSLIPNQP